MGEPDPSDNRRPKSPLVKAAYVGAMGFEFVGVVVGAFLIGSYVDERFGSGPWGVVGSLVAGMIAAGIHVVMIARRFLAEEE